VSPWLAARRDIDAIDTFPSDVAEMPTKDVVLSVSQTEILERLVSSGRYQNASEGLCEELRVVEDQEAQAKARVNALRDAAGIGTADVEAGRYRTFNSPAELNRHLCTLRDRVLTRVVVR
jgi:antitoxin ParD1/3/4